MKGKPSTVFDKLDTYIDEKYLEKINKWIVEHEQLHHTDNFYMDYDKINEQLRKMNTHRPTYNISYTGTHLGMMGAIECESCKRRLIDEYLKNDSHPKGFELSDYLHYHSKEYFYLFTD